MYAEYLIQTAPPEAICLQGMPHELLMDLAEEHAEYMAAANQQGHQNWVTRYNKIKSESDLKATEICAESWPWEKAHKIAAESMWKAWFFAEGTPRNYPTLTPVSSNVLSHKDVCITQHDFFGAAMARGDRVWYACIIVGDKLNE